MEQVQTSTGLNTPQGVLNTYTSHILNYSGPKLYHTVPQELRLRCLPVGGEVMTGACASMFLMKSWVIFSSSSTSLMERGIPEPEPEPEPRGWAGYDTTKQRERDRWEHEQITTWAAPTCSQSTSEQQGDSRPAHQVLSHIITPF